MHAEIEEETEMLDRQNRDCSIHYHMLYWRGRNLWRPSPAKELEPTAACRVGIDIGCQWEKSQE
jgi:hypothetical protein